MAREERRECKRPGCGWKIAVRPEPGEQTRAGAKTRATEAMRKHNADVHGYGR